eukprot:CAMPEP_0194770052 /NCGR_PEP_ID=MMETSP0323_2-20130528/45055_1 /TAXON_ID=2866 ORGANISM="Crypthecodinium cohnii, Strain Seligo" /NCGR_SAMPLE_ID=MMETSP0323_2 /ASSEMBLY_ACC=CAM_ASM_000346 /LENGTH=43 /DNA_ID= /DNA_START= /DNA_END= /DNA_ORIENTATION=
MKNVVGLLQSEHEPHIFAHLARVLSVEGNCRVGRAPEEGAELP